jgi:membrane protease YdiL (CAAX protease family)
LLLLGLFGPMVSGICCTYLTQGKEGRREYWSRIVDPTRIPAKWYLVIFLFVPVLMAIAVLLDIASGGNGTLAEVGKRVAPFFSAPWAIVPFALGVFVRGPFPEELGWRGYVLDRLQSRWNALVSSLILGAIWALWHLPLFFIPDMIHSAQGVWSPWFWQFMAGVIPMAVILTWIFNNTRRSTLAAILFHFVANVTYELANVTPGTNLYSTLLWIIAAIAVVALWGAGTLTRRESVRERMPRGLPRGMRA